MNQTFRALTLTLAVASSPAWADRPLVSETADVIPTGTCQIETAAARVTSSGAPSATGFNALYSCGVAGIHQFAVGYGRARSDGETAQALSLGGKSTLIAPANGVTGLGLAYSVGLAKVPGGSFEHETTTVIGVLTREFADGVLGHANLGWSRSESARLNSAVWSLGVEVGSDRVFAVDVFGDDRARPWLSAGMGWTVVDKVSVNLAYAMQFENPKVKNLSVGFKVVF